MPSPQTVDIEALLAPIAGGNPAGADLRYAGPYDAIQEARRADDELSQGDWQRPTKAADWPAVTKLATDALAVQSKDLQIAAWLIEALAKQHGFPGLRDGFRLLRELQERFWESLYPAIEEGDLDFRSAPLEWLNEKLPPTVRAIPITRPREGITYSWLHWEESRTIDNLGRQSPEAKQEGLAEGKISGEQFDRAVAVTPRAYYETLLEDLNQAWEELDLLEQVVDGKFGRQAPSFLNIKKALEDCRFLVETITREKRKPEPDPVVQQPEHKAESVSPVRPRTSSEGMGFSGTLEPRDRADALKRLAAVAAFFRQTEPHSPVAYLVERAVQWGEMPLEEWLRDVIRDGAVLAHVRETLGLKDSGDS